MSSPLLDIRDLRTGFQTESGLLTAVDGVTLSVEKGRVLGIVGESGSGKSVTAMSILRLLPQPSGRILGGQILFNGVDLTTLPLEEMRKVRGRQISMIFQEPMTALNPVHRIGRQVAESLRRHRGLGARQIGVAGHPQQPLRPEDGTRQPPVAVVLAQMHAIRVNQQGQDQIIIDDQARPITPRQGTQGMRPHQQFSRRLRLVA